MGTGAVDHGQHCSRLRGPGLLGACLLLLVSCTALDDRRPSPGPLVDHHQHLFRSGIRGIEGADAPIDAAALVRLLDEAGMRRAVVLSLAYQPGNPNLPSVEAEYALVKLENDWTSQQVSQYPDRLVGFCGLNPLKDYALEELRRCSRDSHLRAGIKLHFGNSDVQLDDANHVMHLRRVFAEANRHCMGIAVHLHPSVNRRRPFSAAHARVFLDALLPAAPDVVIQIAHLGGAGRYDFAVDEVLSVFVAAAQAGDPRLRNVYFDVSGLAGSEDWRSHAAPIAARLRQLGLQRVLFGSDGAVPGNSPREAWAAIGQLPLREDERRIIAGNVAPYVAAHARDVCSR